MQVQAAYFASKTRKGGEQEFLDTSGKTKEDKSAFDLIMRAKERLLSFDEPVSFILGAELLPRAAAPILPMSANEFYPLVLG